MSVFLLAAELNIIVEKNTFLGSSSSFNHNRRDSLHLVFCWSDIFDDNISTSMNGSQPPTFDNTTEDLSDDILPELYTYHHIQLASAIILCILSPVTVISNGLLLTAIYKDPLRCFRTPMTFFIAGLAVADFLIGLTVEPFFATYFFAVFANVREKPSESFRLIHRIGGIISTVAISLSFFVVLALSVCQYIAVTYPHQFKDIVSRNRVLCFLTVSCVYITSFCMLQFTGIDFNTFLKVDLIIHPTLFSLILIIVQFLLYTSFNRHLQQSNTLRRKASLNQSLKKVNSYKRRHNERQFTIMTFYLTAILLASASLHNVVLYIYLFRKPKNMVENVNIHIGLRISDLMLFIKVALDMFIYAWRLPSYRRALRCTLFGRQSMSRPSFTLRKTSDGITGMHGIARKEPGTEHTSTV